MRNALEPPDNRQTRFPSFIARAAAFLIDWAIVLVLAAFLASSAGVSQNDRFLVLVVVLSLYHLGFLIAISATPGKMALRMHVADPDGGKLYPDRLILRYLAFFVALPLFPISAYMVLTDPQRRAIHDRVAGSTIHPGRPGWIETDG
jgi:uncharacterized RDD family membrane protein YckC